MKRVLGAVGTAASFIFGLIGDAAELRNWRAAGERLEDDTETGQDLSRERPDDSYGYRITHPPDDRS
jgi:hypothetical protein